MTTWKVAFGVASALAALAPLGATRALADEESGPKTYTIGTIGRLGDADARDPAAWTKQELEDWSDPSTGTTVVASRQCGMELRFRLMGTKRRNFVGIEGRVEAATQFDPVQIKMAFGNHPGEARTAAFIFEPGSLELEKGDQIFVAVPFPDKDDFSGENEIKVSAPFGKCTAEAVFKRPAGRTESSSSHLVWTNMQLGVELGGAAIKTGALKDVTDNGLKFQISVTSFPWLNHGIWAGVEFENFGKTASGTGGMGSGTSGMGLYLGYTFRHYVAPHWSLHMDVAPGFYEFASSSGPAGRSLDHEFTLGHRVGVDWIFGRLGEPDFMDSDHAVGLLLCGDWFPNASIGGQRAAGYNFAVQLRYLFGI